MRFLAFIHASADGTSREDVKTRSRLVMVVVYRRTFATSIYRALQTATNKGRYSKVRNHAQVANNPANNLDACTYMSSEIFFEVVDHALSEPETANSLQMLERTMVYFFAATREVNRSLYLFFSRPRKKGLTSSSELILNLFFSCQVRC